MIRLTLALALSLALTLLAGSRVAVADIVFGYRFEVEDLAGNPLPNNTIAAGQDFQLAAFVKDLRVPQAAHPGVFAGFVDVAYDPLATIATGAVVTHSPLQIHGASSIGIYTLSASGSVSTPGEILHAGGADLHQFAQDNPAEQPLWTVHLHAAAAGIEHFTSSFDASPGDDTLLYGINDSILADQILFGTATLTITPEPSSVLLAASGLLCLGAGIWRRRRARRGL